MVRLDCPPVPRQRADAELARLRADFSGRWEITRAVDHGGTPGAWHASRTDKRRALRTVSAQDPAELRAVLVGADR